MSLTEQEAHTAMMTPGLSSKLYESHEQLRADLAKAQASDDCHAHALFLLQQESLKTIAERDAAIREIGPTAARLARAEAVLREAHRMVLLSEYYKAEIALHAYFAANQAQESTEALPGKRPGQDVSPTPARPKADECATAGANPAASVDPLEGGCRGLEADIRNALNYHSAENASDTPDFVLAAYLLDCLAAWNKAIKARVIACPPPGPPKEPMSPDERTAALFDKWGGALEKMADGASPPDAGGGGPRYFACGPCQQVCVTVDEDGCCTQCGADTVTVDENHRVAFPRTGRAREAK